MRKKRIQLRKVVHSELLFSIMFVYQSISVGIGTSYSLYLNQKDVESCPQKDAIFNVIRTGENARAANAFSRSLENQLADPAKSWRLEQLDSNHWKLYPMLDGVKGAAIQLRRDLAGGY